MDKFVSLVREFNDKGLVRLLEVPQNFKNFVRFLPESLVERLDLSNLELKNRVFITANLGTTETDLLYSVPCRRTEELSPDEAPEHVIVYLLNELNTRTDNRIGLKIYIRRGQIWEYLERNWKELESPRPPFRLQLVIAIIVYLGSEPWNSSLELDDLVDVPEGLGAYLPKWQTVFLPLKDIDPDLLLNEGTGTALSLLTLQTALFHPEQLQERIKEVCEAMTKLYEDSEWKDAAEYVIATILNKGREDLQATLFNMVEEAATKRARKDEVNEVQEMIVTGADALRAEGEKKGKEEALSQIKEPLNDLLQLHIKTKFGEETAKAALAGRQLEMPQTLELIKRLLTATKIEDLGLDDIRN